MNDLNNLLAKLELYSANHYESFPVVFERGRGVWVTDTEGKKYIDAVAGYSSANHGHRHHRIDQVMIDAIKDDMVSTTPNSMRTKAQALFLEAACEAFGYDKIIPMNTGADAVETALKLALLWAHAPKRKGGKGLSKNAPLIIACEGNFHGRTRAIVSCSSEPKYREPFAPLMRGYRMIPYGDADALERELKKQRGRVAAVLFEPIQGEGGIIIPPQGYLKDVRDLCDEHEALMIADEVQTGLGRAGEMLACDHEGVRSDIVAIGKSLGGGVIPVSAVLAKKEYTLFEPGHHGSTYAGGALAMTVAREALAVIKDEQFCLRSQRMGAYLKRGLRERFSMPDLSALSPEIRGRALMIGIELVKGLKPRSVVESLLAHGVLAKDAHGVIRVTPPLIISEPECDMLVERIGKAFAALAGK